MTALDDQIPIVDTYRGVGIHDEQPAERIEGVVKPEIDAVLAISAIGDLAAWARDITRSPEARLLAAAKLQAAHQIAADERRVRPDIDLDLVRAYVAGLNSRRCQSPTEYCSKYEVPSAPGMPGAVRREQPGPASPLIPGT